VKVKPRLAKLEARLPKGCAACRDWWHTVLIDDFGAARRPERCPGCGRLVPIRTVVHLVGVHLDRV
jgi:hypothetical protein